MKKRIIFLLMAVCLLAGCAAPGTPDQTDLGADVPHIVVTVPVTSEAVISGIQQVQDAVNAITVPQIGVAVEFMVVSAKDTGTEYPNAITKGQRIDLMLLNNENIQNYIGQNMLLPLDTLLTEYGQGIQAISQDYIPLDEGTVSDGKTYGLRIPGDQMGSCGGLWINPELLEKVSFPYDPEKIYTFGELDVLFSRLKEAYPDAYPLGQITNNYGFTTSSFFLGLPADSLNASDPISLEVGSDSTRLVNYYEMDCYRNWLAYMRKWYLDGFIYPDSAVTAATSIGLYRSGVVLSVPLLGDPYMLTEATAGTPIVALRLSSVYIGRGGNTGLFWTVPVTSQEPEAAMKFLNMMYTDERIINLLSWGIRGRDYDLDEKGAVYLLDTLEYSIPLGVFGDQRKCYDFYGEEGKQVKAEFAAQAVPVNFQYSGFTFDTSTLVQEMLEVDKVENQYIKLLEAGCVDLDTAYPEFIQKLYDAGLQRIQDEKQRQLDAWLMEE